MKNSKSHFWYNKSQRNGILFLALLIITIQFAYYFIDFSSNKKFNIDTAEILAFQSKIDSLKLIEIEKRKPKIYPFNPSFITDYKGYKLGMSTVEIDKLLSYRKQGKYINSAKQFQQVTGINDSLLHKLSPYFKFPDWISNKKKFTYNKSKNNSFTGKKKNLNQTTEKELQQISGIGIKLSARIIKFRNSIGGYQTKEQLAKVYGLKPELVNAILNHFYIKNSNLEKITKKTKILDLNKVTSEELKLVNGIGEKLSARIIKYRNSIQGFHYEDQLNEVYGLKPEVITRLLKQFKILSKPSIKKIDINEASFKDVLHLPYIDYELTKKIFEYKEEFAEIQNLEELKKIQGFPLDKFDRIVLYLKTE
jgi:competence ComEA-like helix-hairpin-helix protein